MASETMPGRDVRGRWLKGTCGYPQDLLSD